MRSAHEVKLLAGETQIVASDRAPLTLHPPAGETIEVRDTAMYRAQGDTGRLLAIDIRKPPLWLQGFQGTSVIDPLGSLVAQIDGRNEPLSLGVHAVTVDIRDQIARTVIEESFVNHTAGRLEGVFYFPLPADASISGFGIWVGDRLVEADVVEKQRAREIYETLLRERVDPGLLEWTSGNVFKARVYPIEPRSDKRIRITYTQVLPQRDNRFRYSYALPGEMLRQHPLRELTIDVKVSSVLPLAQVSCPTHPARIDKTGHAARVEFSAQHYVPDRDFEVVVELERGQPDAVLIPHRRGEDGYFMCLIGTGAGASAALPDGSRLNEGRDGETLELLVLADTSGSMDAGSRRRQQEFIAALFGGLAPEDRINLAVCDAACEWVFPQAESATEDRVAAVRDFLAGRSSLGWTDLNKAIAAAAKQAAGRRGGQTHVIYVGDGVVTAGDADPVAVGKRLGATWPGGQAVTHAVSVSSRCEPLVLNVLAALGGGSVRQISGESTPQRVAAEFLAELTQPGLRDVRLEFRGLRVARVYPERLPNLPLGSQQIVLGRYLPEDADQQGELVLTGSRAGKPFQSSTKIVLRDAEQGNEFIPRLWARRHLDALLQQGNSAAIRDEIIALSERFHLITPYTSLLVLESDALRERFQVSRRFQISDGQRFFAEGREQADFELRQQQMQRAGTWRLGLRQRTLEQLGQMGRDIEFLPPAWHINYLPVLEPLVSRSSRKGYSPDDLAALRMERDPARAFAYSAGGSGMGGYDAWDVDNQGDGSDFAGEGAGGRSVSDTGGDSTGHNEDLEDEPPSGRYEPQSAYESNVDAVAAVVEDQYQTVGGRPRRASERTLFEGFDLEPVRKSWAASYGVPYVTSVIPVVDGQGRKSGQILGWTGDDENWLSGLRTRSPRTPWQRVSSLACLRRQRSVP